MTRKELLDLGIRPATLDKLQLNVTRAVIEEEFDRRGCVDGYRERSIQRLVQLGVPFTSEANLGSVLAERYLRAVCPYCNSTMTAHGQGGNADTHGVEFRCECGAKLHLSIPHNALRFKPLDKSPH